MAQLSWPILVFPESYLTKLVALPAQAAHTGVQSHVDKSYAYSGTRDYRKFRVRHFCRHMEPGLYNS